MTLGSNTIFWQHKPFYLDGAVQSNEVQKLVYEGDSLAFATFGTFWLYERPPGPNVNLAVPGSTIATMSGAGRVAACDAELATKALLVVWCGTNTLATGADTVAAGDAAANALFTYCDNRIAAGWTAPNAGLLIINCLPRNDAGFPQVARTQFNVRMAADAPSHSSGAVIDCTGLPGVPGDSRNYDPDLVHGYPLGYQWLHRNVTAPRFYSFRF